MNRTRIATSMAFGLHLAWLAPACARPAPPAAAPLVEEAPPPPSDASTESPATCEARVGHLDGACFASAAEACAALDCQPPRACTFGYSMPVVVACATP